MCIIVWLVPSHIFSFMMFYVCYVYCNKIVCLLLSGYLRMGLRGRELMSNVGKVMIQGGGTFGTFMSIGTAIRC